MWTGEAVAAINLTISASTERQWQGIRRPRGLVRVLTSSPRSGMMPIGIRTMTRRRAIARAGCCPGRTPVFIGSAIAWARCADGLAGERWVKRLAVVIAALMVIFAGCFGGLWWRLGAGPINLEMATPWLAAAIEENIGHGNTVEVGGTQIERAGRIRIAVRIRDIIVRDRDHAVVASAPKAEVRAVGHRAVDGTAARREPQSGRCRTVGAHHAGWLRDRFRRRQRQAAGHRRCFEKTGGPCADISASNPRHATARSRCSIFTRCPTRAHWNGSR